MRNIYDSEYLLANVYRWPCVGKCILVDMCWKMYINEHLQDLQFSMNELRAMFIYKLIFLELSVMAICATAVMVLNFIPSFGL